MMQELVKPLMGSFSDLFALQGFEGLYQLSLLFPGDDPIPHGEENIVFLVDVLD
jgi:hypothetical protein